MAVGVRNDPAAFPPNNEIVRREAGRIECLGVIVGTARMSYEKCTIWVLRLARRIDRDLARPKLRRDSSVRRFQPKRTNADSVS